MGLELVPVTPDMVPRLSRICHLAFNTLHERHNVPRDVPTEEVGGMIIGGVAHRPDYAGVAAVLEGKIVGSNFLLTADEVAGVGPITVDPTVQAKGIGRALMQWVIDRARAQGLRHVRLFQEAVNTTSLSLYSSLGFSWRDAAALMTPTPLIDEEASIRPMSADDLPRVDRLSRDQFGFSRINDTGRLLGMGLPGHVRTRGGQVVGYQVSTLFGHAAAETPEDLLALASHAAAQLAPPMAVIIVPLAQQGLFHKALAKGYRVVKVLNYMSLETYTPPPGNHLPSIQS